MNPDRKIQQDVLNELIADPAVNAAHIGVAVDGHIVTLTGHVCSYFEKFRAEKAAKRVVGVQGLVMEIGVKIPGEKQRSDEDIVGIILSVLAWNSAIPKDGIKVMVEKGWVTLRGHVAWNYQRQIIHQAIVGVTGVKGITDHMILKPEVSGIHIKDRIDEALKRQAVLDASKISVKVDGSQVTLEGSVSNWNERHVIREVVWSTGGVEFLVDRMRYEGAQRPVKSHAPVL
jgi:osmotically-inducible protein OsmY